MCQSLLESAKLKVCFIFESMVASKVKRPSFQNWMLTDMALDLAAFNPPGRSSRSPDEVAEGMSEEEVENGPLGGLYKGMKVRAQVLSKMGLEKIVRKALCVEG